MIIYSVRKKYESQTKFHFFIGILILIVFISTMPGVIEKGYSLLLTGDQKPSVSQKSSIILTPVDWRTYQNDYFGFSLKHPPDTYIKEEIPGTARLCASSLPHCIVEERLYVAGIYNFGDESFKDQNINVQPIMIFKIVQKPPDKNTYELAEYFSQKCFKSIVSPLEGITLPSGVEGFTYSCAEMGIYTDFWCPLDKEENILFGATWYGDEQVVADQIIRSFRFFEL